LEEEILGQDLDDISQILNNDFMSIFKKIKIVSNFSFDSE